jgi:hypothetical protein
MTEKFECQHVLLYGSSGGGKTFYIRRAIKKYPDMKIYVLAPESNQIEWQAMNAKLLDEESLPDIPQQTNSIIVLDDCEALVRNETVVNDIFSKGGRHKQIAFITAHADKAITKEVRMNASKIIIFSRNSGEMFT